MAFLTQSQLIEPVLPKAAQLGSHFLFISNAHLEMRPDEEHSSGEESRER